MLREPDVPVVPDPGRGGAAAPLPRRIDVAVNAEMITAIRRLTDGEGVSLTEAVRRLVCYGDALHRIAVDGGGGGGGAVSATVVTVARDQLGTMTVRPSRRCRCAASAAFGLWPAVSSALLDGRRR